MRHIKNKSIQAYAGEYRSPLGPIYAASIDDFVTDIFIGGEEKEFLKRLASKYGCIEVKAGKAIFLRLFHILDCYFSGGRVNFDVPVKPSGSAFDLKVWRVLSRIPYGATLSYKDVAKRLGMADSARARWGLREKPHPHNNPLPQGYRL